MSCPIQYILDVSAIMNIIHVSVTTLILFHYGGVVCEAYINNSTTRSRQKRGLRS